MAKKKLIDAQGQVVEVTPPETVAAPHLLSVICLHDFTDGNIPFQDLGYSATWPKNEIRALPLNIYERCLNSGAKVEIVGMAQ